MSIYCSKMILVYCIFLAVLIGSVMGSFLNCVAYRISNHTSFTKGRSHCPNCHHVLNPIDLIPIVSWCLTKGKCRYCHKAITIRYPLSEAIMMMLTILCLLRFDLSWECLRNYILICTLFTLSCVDLEIFEIPDSCIVIGIVNWVCFNFLLQDSWFTHILASILYSGSVLLLSLVMDRILQKESMGGGDIKLLIVMGLYLGVISGMMALLLACVLGIVSSFVVKKDEELHIPFGPAISMAFVLVLLYGQPWVAWYLGMF